ncbi:Protein of unknown function [Curtobacterium sp. UNCCL20]|uniref:DUF3800 domain-containing protein n=1 Tax=Curtobacterium sp. UNCCL20 TaxID=1502773 RepID=UPI000891309A|nr:DUF3800 domain-containing protein [Curtobacterium sp. UNCCL20]SDQ62403.1 Protein of unknown function [Curtobacterium sp. UNCCL20]
MPDPLSRLIYIDDSGHQPTGLLVFGWVSLSPQAWRPVLRRWLELRKTLSREHGIDVERELHATDFVNGRGRISSCVPDRYVHDGVTYWKDLGRELAVRLLREMSCFEGMTVGAVFRRVDPHPLQAEKVSLYRDLVRSWEQELSADGELAMLFMDGNGTDHSYRTAHRQLQLDVRRIIEDPLMIDSASSHLVQMADLAAWCAYVAVERPRRHEFAWSWYEDHLSVRDPHRRPLEMPPGHSETP